MNLYNQVYGDVLNDANIKFKKLHNLYLLKGLRQKINCFKTNQNKADQYYDCFYEIEGAMIRQGQQFVTNCQQIDVHLIEMQDEYKICLSDCKQNYKADGKKKEDCFNACGTKFKNSIAFLYNNFYETHVGKQSQYKSAKKI